MKTLSTIANATSKALAISVLLLGTPVLAAGNGKDNRAKKADPMQVVRGAKAWKNNCGRCHNLRSPKELNDEEWDVSVAHMRVRANLLGFEAEDIKAFLKASN